MGMNEWVNNTKNCPTLLFVFFHSLIKRSKNKYLFYFLLNLFIIVIIISIIFVVVIIIYLSIKSQYFFDSAYHKV